jgi:predicted ArsR family transcriptional regulator
MKTQIEIAMEMADKNSPFIVRFYEEIHSPKNKILFACENEEKNILQLSKELKIGYQSVYRHVTDLKKKGLIEVPKAKKKVRGKERAVKLTQKGREEVKILKEFKDMAPQDMKDIHKAIKSLK